MSNAPRTGRSWSGPAQWYDAQYFNGPAAQPEDTSVGVELLDGGGHELELLVGQLGVDG